MRVLVLGAGAVGQVYGYHLQRGGVDLTFYVKEKYADDLRDGVTLYPLKSKKKRVPVSFSEYDVLTSPEAVREAGPWDQLWLCISATAIRGDWLQPMLDAVGDAVVVSLLPGLEDRGYLLERIPEPRLVNGVITFNSYQAPLAGTDEEVPEPGIAFYHPPLTKNPFSGPPEAVDAIVSALKKGGCPAKAHENAPFFGAIPSAIMMPHLVGLEASDWKLKKLSKSPILKTASLASRQAIQVACHHHNAKPPFLRRLVRPWIMKVVLWAAPKTVPYDFQAFMQYHFTKVRDQTQLMMRTYIEQGQAAGLETSELQALLDAV